MERSSSLNDSSRLASCCCPWVACPCSCSWACCIRFRPWRLASAVTPEACSLATSATCLPPSTPPWPRPDACSFTPAAPGSSARTGGGDPPRCAGVVHRLIVLCHPRHLLGLSQLLSAIARQARVVAPVAGLPKRSAAATPHGVTYTLNLREKFIWGSLQRKPVVPDLLEACAAWRIGPAPGTPAPAGHASAQPCHAGAERTLPV